MDSFSKEERSRIMSRIRSFDTKPEVAVRKYLFSKGLRYRKNVSTLPGKPDLVFPKYKTVVFIHGCFWHGHSCKAATLPETRREFWEKKIEGNKNRDNDKVLALQALGWKVLTVWQCEIKNKVLFEKRIEVLIEEIIQ